MSSLDQFAIDEMRKKRSENWNENVRYHYPLDKTSMVWDVGGWDGDFSARISSAYDSHIDIFEVIPRVSHKLDVRFDSYPNIQVHDYGLGDRNERIGIRDMDECTSTLISGTTEVEIHRSSDEIVVPLDLIKINIEGYEYRLLHDLCVSEKIEQINYLQIQFHDYVVMNGIYIEVPYAHELYRDTVDRLSKTHERQWCQPWVWESWKRKS